MNSDEEIDNYDELYRQYADEGEVDLGGIFDVEELDNNDDVDYEYYADALGAPLEYVKQYTEKELKDILEFRQERPEIDEMIQESQLTFQQSDIERLRQLKKEYELACREYKKGTNECERKYRQNQIIEQQRIEKQVERLAKGNEIVFTPFIKIRFGTEECYQKDILDTQLLYWMLQSRTSQFERDKGRLRDENRLRQFQEMLGRIQANINRKSLFSRRKVNPKEPYGTPEQMLMMNNMSVFQYIKDQFENGELGNEYEFQYRINEALLRTLNLKKESEKTQGEKEYMKLYLKNREFPIVLSSFKKIVKPGEKKKEFFYSGDELRRLINTTKYYNYIGPQIKGKGRKRQIIYPKTILGLNRKENELLVDMIDSHTVEIEKQQKQFKMKLATQIVDLIGIENKSLLVNCNRELFEEPKIELERMPKSFIDAAKQLGMEPKQFQDFFFIEKHTGLKRPRTGLLPSQYIGSGEVPYIKSKSEIVDEELMAEEISLEERLRGKRQKRWTPFKGLIRERIIEPIPPYQPKSYYQLSDGRRFEDRDEFIFERTLLRRRNTALLNVIRRTKKRIKHLTEQQIMENLDEQFINYLKKVCDYFQIRKLETGEVKKYDNYIQRLDCSGLESLMYKLKLEPPNPKRQKR